MKLEELRKKIDKVDKKILDLLNQRGEVAIRISHLKKDKNINAYSPDREAKIISRLKKINKGPLFSKDIEGIFQEILSVCRAKNKIVKIAYFGTEAAFTHMAALKIFGKSADYQGGNAISDVFNSVENLAADYGVVPIENSTEGAVNHTLDMLIDSELKICSEAYLPIEHNLLSKCNAISSIKKVYSHPQVLAQCRHWLERHMLEVQVEVGSTTKAAQIATREKDSAAIASKLAGKRFKLNALARSIEDSPHNITRFLVIGKQDVEPTKHDKTSIVFSMKDKAGALHDVLVPFKKAKINLTKIESRPSKRKAWKYYFFVDMTGHKNNSSVQKALRQLEKQCTFFKILGSYPKGS